MKRILILPLLILSIFLRAENNPPQPQYAPGGAGGDGFGVAASPIDMYVYVLAVVAIFMIFFYVKKYYRSQTA